MPTVEEMARAIVLREGGYVEDPDDPGGATNHGVTLARLRGAGMDLTGDGQVDRADLRALSTDQAADLFIRSYFRAPHIDLLPAPLQPPVFDMQVNAGIRAVSLLQGVLCRMGQACAVDGSIGPQTAAAAAAAAKPDPQPLIDAYGIARRNYYYALADARPASRKYARTTSGGKGGWILRAEEFISPRYRLTAAEHRERCRAWA